MFRSRDAEQGGQGMGIQGVGVVRAIEVGDMIQYGED